MDTTYTGNAGNGFSLDFRISLTIHEGSLFICSLILLFVWLCCRNNTNTLNNITTTSTRHCHVVSVNSSDFSYPINRCIEPLYSNDHQCSPNCGSHWITLSSSNSAKHGVEHDGSIEETTTGNGIHEQSNQTDKKHKRVNSSSGVEHVEQKQKCSYTCIYDRKWNYDAVSGADMTTAFGECHAIDRWKHVQQNATDRTSDERENVLVSLTDSGISEPISTVRVRNGTNFDQLKASDKNSDNSLDSADSGISLDINTLDKNSDSSGYERREQTNSSKDFRNPPEEQNELDIENISINQTIPEKDFELECEFKDTLMSFTTECDHKQKDDGIEEDDNFEETIPKSLYKVQPPRRSLSVYRKSEDIFHHVSKDSEDDFVGLTLVSLEPAAPTSEDARLTSANAPDKLENERSMDTTCAGIPSEETKINIDSKTHGKLHKVLKTCYEDNQMPKDESYWPFYSNYKYSDDIFSRECSLIASSSLLRLNYNTARQSLSSLFKSKSKGGSRVLVRRRERRRHGKAHKENIRMVFSRYETNRFFRNFKSEVKRVFPYRKCSLRYNTSAERSTGLWNRRNSEGIVLPFLNPNEIHVPRPDSRSSEDGNRERSRARDVVEHPIGAIDVISVASVTESTLYEWGRLRSFWSFPIGCPVSPLALAKYGFYYSGSRDEVICFCCNVSHSNWRRGDSVYAVHYQISRRCRFMNGEDVGNIPIHGPLSCLSRRAGGKDGASVETAEEIELKSMLSTPETVTSLLLEHKSSNKVEGSERGGPSPQVEGNQTKNHDRLHVGDNPGEMSNNTECGEGSKFSLSGFQAAVPSNGTSISQAAAAAAAEAAVSQESTMTLPGPDQTPSASKPACLQTHASTNSQTSKGLHTATGNTATPAANRLLTGPNASPTSSQEVPAPTSSQPPTVQTNSQQQSINQQHPTTLAQHQQHRRQEQQNQREQHVQEQEQGQVGPGMINGAATNLNNHGVTTAKPRYPNYAALAVRSGTFNGFPNHLDQTPIQMAKAGFFYAGYGDYVRCFFCGGGLRNWEPGDDPWVEHARWFPRCAYVKQNRGQTYINLVLQRQRELTLPNEYVNTTREASSIANSQAQTTRMQANTDRQSNDSNERSNTQNGTSTNTLTNEQNSTSSVFNEPARNSDQVARQTNATADEMNSPAVLSVKNLGYGERIIQNALQHFRNTHGSVNLTALALLEIIFGFNDNPPETPDQTQTCSQSAEGPQIRRETNNTENKIKEPQAGAATAAAGATAATSQHLITKNKLKGDRPAHSYTEEELKSIQEENSQLKEQMKCKICMDNSVCISFLPCGHLCCCAECAPAMVKCPICRQIIRGSVKTYLS